jgi:hypothetical protein
MPRGSFGAQCHREALCLVIWDHHDRKGATVPEVLILDSTMHFQEPVDVSMTRYGEAMRSVLGLLQGAGYEWGLSHVNHAPMAAEAMAWLGYTDEVSDWVAQNIKRRSYDAPPKTQRELSERDPTEWVLALGDFSRVSDWSAMFSRLLADESWSDVLTRWWPRLLPGISGALMHGVIRTAHAVRALAFSPGDITLQRVELAQALGYWAARYPGGPSQDQRLGPVRMRTHSADTGAESPAALLALDDLVAESADAYASVAQAFPVPLIHATTGPAAVRLLCDYLPPELHRASYYAAARCSSSIRTNFEHGERLGRPSVAEPSDVAAAAIELGDEHAIKLAEVAVRYNSVSPDERYLAASTLATAQIARSPT